MGTIFLRFGGCNLRCPGWPCDTPFAILPAHRDEWTKRTANDVLAECRTTAEAAGIANVCLTGGEPFIQKNEALRHIVEGLLDADISVEAFSNGQVHYPRWAFDNVNFVMDWKLQGSGNAANDPGVLPLMLSNIRNLKPTDAIKFVVGSTLDFSEAKEVWFNYHDQTEAQFWAGIVWDGGLRTDELIKMIQAEGLPWNLNVQVHKYIWSPEERGV
jgi:7-carboxy-7-deazaguanine synthase